jgi:tetratricopeptide (TPR) repeat protein
MDKHRFAPLLQLAGGVVLGLTLVVTALRWMAGTRAEEGTLITVGAAAFLLLIGVGLGMTLLGLSAVLNRPAAAARTTSTNGDHSELRETLLELRDEFNLLRSNIATEMARREVAEEDAAAAPPSDVPTNPFAIPPPPPPAADAPSLQKVLHTLEEVREIALMNEQQRQDLLHKRRTQKKLDRLKRAQAEIRVGHWAEAQRLLDLVAQDHAQDHDLHQVQDELRIARADAETEAVERARRRIEDLMALGSWDEALEIVERLAGDYPDSAEARTLHERVTRERELFRDNTAERIYKEVRNHIEHRNWRRARTEAVRLLEKFADHRRAARIREQMTVIRDNADVEERLEQEKRIQELIKARRLGEAIELAEQLIERYPDSPQAKGLEEMLPRLRERAIREEIGT